MRFGLVVVLAEGLRCFLSSLSQCSPLRVTDYLRISTALRGGTGNDVELPERCHDIWRRHCAIFRASRLCMRHQHALDKLIAARCEFDVGEWSLRITIRLSDFPPLDTCSAGH